jgi:signal transduction histidine kinase
MIKETQKPKILIVDDEGVNIKILEKICEDLGYDTMSAVNGKDAVKIAFDAQPDLILMDIMMPVMDGFEATDRLKKNSLTRHIPIIIVTALQSREDMLRGISMGADDFLTKPIDSEEVSLRIRNSLNVKRYHDLLKEYNRALEMQVSERTLELFKKNMELEQILYVTSHDLRSPVVNIQGYCAELAESIDELRSILQSDDIPENTKMTVLNLIDKEIPDNLGFITDNVSKIDRLHSGVMQLLLTGKTEITKEQLDMNDLVSFVLKNLERQVKKSKVKVDVSDLPGCSADREMMTQVFSHLISNAVKFLDPERPGEVTVSGYKDDNLSVYCVEDNGIGIPPEYQEYIFKIFHRLDITVKGEGLGLSVVNKIIERHDGRIWVESEPGHGSSFYISLPSGDK